MCLACLHGILSGCWVLDKAGLYWTCKLCKFTVAAEDTLTTLRVEQEKMNKLEEQSQAELLARQAAEPVMKAWDDLIVPVPDVGEETCDYIDRLKETIRELARKANEHESVSQALAQANVRQTKIVERMRKENHAMKVAIARAATAAEEQRYE